MKAYLQILLCIAGVTLYSCDNNKHIETEEEKTENPVDTNDTNFVLKKTGTGVYTFDSYAPMSDKPMNIYYHIPYNATAESPVLMVFHGNGRDALESRDALIAKANSLDFLVVVPEFSRSNFPGGDGYILGNVFEDGDHPSEATLNDESIWTFSLVDPIFESFKELSGTLDNYYDVFGHSGGAQFAHRFLLFKPNAQFDQVIAASAGWYTMPDTTVRFPYGLKDSPVVNTDLQNLFNLPVQIIVGQLDNNPNSGGLRHTPQADVQGDHRLERANYYYTNSQIIAGNYGFPFRWTYRTLPNVDHDFNQTSSAAANILYNK